jgi:hypothetical protein
MKLVLVFFLAASILGANNLVRRSINADRITTGTLNSTLLPATGTWSTGVNIQTTGVIETTDHISADKIRPTTDDNNIRVQNKAGTSDIIFIDVAGVKVGIQKVPEKELDVEGEVRAGAFIGDGSQLTNVPTGASSLPSVVVTASDYTAGNKERIICNTLVASCEITPPTTSIGNWFEVYDAGNASVNSIRILTGGAKIMSETNNILINDNYTRLFLVYLGASTGWRIKAP